MNAQQPAFKQARPLTPPSPEAQAPFAPDFAPRVLLTIDTEEEFDWGGSFSRDGHGLKHVDQLARFQTFCEEIGAYPIYLVDWPITQSDQAVEIIGQAVRRGTAEVGLQLHAWVNPPFEEDVSVFNSFAGNLPPDLEAAKFAQLYERITTCFGVAPILCRSGRYGLGANTPEILKNIGITIDTSVRSRFDYSAYGGPDYSDFPITPYWLDPQRSLLELPVTTAFWGILRNQGVSLHRLGRRFPWLLSLLSRLGLLERVALTPEGVSANEAIRGIDIALDEGVPVLVLSFHSPSLAPGHTPYTTTPDEVEQLYSWFRQIYAYLDARGVRSATSNDILEAAHRG